MGENYSYSSYGSAEDMEDDVSNNSNDGYELDMNDEDKLHKPPTSTDLKAEVIEPDKLKNEMDQIVNKAVAVIGYAPHVVKALLNQFSWDCEKLFERFFEAESPEVFFKKQKIAIPHPNFKDFVEKEGDCMICFTWKKNLVGFSCRHFFCKDCWNSYFVARTRSEGDAFCFCPESGCRLPIAEEHVLQLLKDEKEKEFFQNLLIQTFVNTNSLMRWCPSEKCKNVLKVKTAEYGQATCTCGTSICFLCLQEWHEPLSCQLLARWLKKCNDDSETSNWLSANTKDCPKCHVTIEKDGGCNHMTCRSQTCKFEFCWMCMGPWKPHGSGWYSCNRYEDKEAKEARSAQEISRAALQRYLHYYNRFVNHKNSLKLENKLHDQIKIKQEQMQAQSFSWVECDFLTKAVEALNQCRRTLMYTYAFAYYLEANNATTIFENNQQDLELATEQLSEKLERELDIENEDLVVLKQNVQDKAKYVGKRREILLKHCLDGLEHNEWKFTVPFYEHP